MNISEILEQMEDVMESAWSMPLTGGKSVVDVGQLKDLIHDIRANLPEEIRQAQALMENRQKVLDEAKQEADRIIRQAQEQADEMVQEHAITEKAQEKADELLRNTAAQAKEMQQKATEFADKRLINAEKALQTAAQALAETAGQVQNSRAGLLQK